MNDKKSFTLDSQTLDHISSIISLITDSVEQHVSVKYITSLEEKQKSFETDLQQVKGYVLSLEERLEKLEIENRQLKQDVAHLGNEVEDISKSNKTLQESLSKKHRFWKLL